MKKSIQSVTHIPMINSITDHAFLKITINTLGTHKDVGPSFWKCNIKTLDDLDFLSDFQRMFNDYFEKESIMSTEVWDTFKVKCKELIKIHSFRLNLNLKLKYKELQSKYIKCVRCL